MGLVNSNLMLQKAVKEKYAIGHFNVSNLEELDSIFKAAQAMRSPIIVALTTGFIKYYGLSLIDNLLGYANAKYDIPFAIHLDHHIDADDIAYKINNSQHITSVMIDASKLDYHNNVLLTKKVVGIARNKEISVEAELGAMKGQEEELQSDEFYYTNVNEALRFIEETKIDALAISIGTIHGCVKKMPLKLDLNRLAELRGKTQTPLVLHGSSGLDDEQIKEVVKMGINKINIATELKVVYHERLKSFFQDLPSEIDSRKYFTNANEGVVETIKHKLMLFGSSNKG